MAKISLPGDFKDFLKFLDQYQVKYLLIGGYAVGYYGYPRATGDMDIWISIEQANASKMIEAIKAFGFNNPELSSTLFTEQKKIIRMGIPPIRIEVLSEIDGIDFETCYQNRIIDIIDDITVNIIDLASLKINKKASGRLKDLSDLEYLP